MSQLIGEFYPVIRRHYREIAGTTGTAKVVRHWLPTIKPLGHGAAKGDHSPVWRTRRMLPVVLAYVRERFQLQRQIHLFAFFDHEAQVQEPFREMLTASLLRTGAYWFPTPVTARAYLHALQVGQMEVSPQFGTFHGNERAFAVAMQHITAGEHTAALEILDILYKQIVRTGEQQSRVWLLPAVQVVIDQLQRSS